MSNINAKNINSENITVTNLTVTNINGRPYSGAGCCGSYYTSCPGCDGDPNADPCDGNHGCEDDPDVDPCDCFVPNPCLGPQGAQGATLNILGDLSLGSSGTKIQSNSTITLSTNVPSGSQSLVFPTNLIDNGLRTPVINTYLSVTINGTQYYIPLYQ
jgi:hypothetical protein